MLLKVSDGAGGWVFIDKVEEVHLLPKQFSVTSPAELITLFEGEQVGSLISKECFHGNGKVQIGVIEFLREEKRRKVLFTNIAFICNDDGDTLDRYNTERKHQQKR